MRAFIWVLMATLLLFQVSAQDNVFNKDKEMERRGEGVYAEGRQIIKSAHGGSTMKSGADRRWQHFYFKGRLNASRYKTAERVNSDYISYGISTAYTYGSPYAKGSFGGFVKDEGLSKRRYKMFKPGKMESKVEERVPQAPAETSSEAS